MDPFAVIMLGGTGGLVLALYLLGRWYPGSGADVVDWRPTRSPEVEAQNELDDLEQMLEVANRRRRRRGEPELTEDALNDIVQAENAAALRRQEEYMADVEIEQMIEAKNVRRRARGLPELDVAQERARLLGGPGA